MKQDGESLLEAQEEERNNTRGGMNIMNVTKMTFMP
jgi:hypothetical protein